MSTRDTKQDLGLLADFMCFSVYSTNLAYSRVYRPVLEKLGVTYPQYIAIVSLWEQDKQTVNELSEKLFLEPSTVTPMLKKLEAQGYLTRTRDEKDERVVRIALTKKGRQTRLQAAEYSQLTVQASGLDKAQFRKLQREIASLRDNLTRAATSARAMESSDLLKSEHDEK